MNRKKFHLLTAFFLLFMVASLFTYVFNQFSLKKIFIISPSNTISGLEVFNSQNILFLDYKRIESKLLLRNLEIKRIKLEKLFPNTLKIYVEFRMPVAVIFNSLSDKRMYVDAEGVVLSSNLYKTGSLPLIEISSISVSPSSVTDWRIVKALSFLEYMLKESIIVDRIFVDEKKSIFSIFLSEGTEVIVSQTASPEFTVASLQTITSRFRIEGKFVRQIDFRFDKPVVILSNGGKISSP